MKRIKERFFIKTDLEEHLNSYKNTSIKSFLYLLDMINIDEKENIRKFFLDCFNNYHREVLRVLENILNANDN